jgi:uncharacterized protein with GYD domain
MPTFIVTGNYTSKGMKGMVDNPSDREAAARAITEAAGGKLTGFYLTSGESDFMLIVEAKDSADMVAALMVAGASGSVSGLKTIRAYSNAEFNAIQKAAGAIAGKFKPAG